MCIYNIMRLPSGPVHLRDILEEREIADPLDLTETDPREDSISTSLSALLGMSMLFSLRKSSMRGPKSGRSSPRFLNRAKTTSATGSVSCSCRTPDRTPVEPDAGCSPPLQPSSSSSCPASIPEISQLGLSFPGTQSVPDSA